jgi:hypothetical protein
VVAEAVVAPGVKLALLTYRLGLEQQTGLAPVDWKVVKPVLVASPALRPELPMVLSPQPTFELWFPTARSKHLCSSAT